MCLYIDARSHVWVFERQSAEAQHLVKGWHTTHTPLKLVHILLALKLSCMKVILWTKINHQRNTCQVHRKEEVPLHGWVGNEVFLFSSSLHLCSSVTEFNYTPYAEAAPSVWLTAVAARTQLYIYINPALRATVLHICPEHVLAQSALSRASLAPGLCCKMWLNEQRPRRAACLHGETLKLLFSKCFYFLMN